MSDHVTVDLPQGTIRYRETGPRDGEPIVFVHGFLVDGRLWDGVAEGLAGGYRCIQPDWPMGSHRVAMNPDADLTPPGIARMIADFLEALDLERVTIVGNDSGGAMTQVTVTTHPERIGRMVLTNCDTHENFPPGMFGPLPKLARVPGVMTAMAMPLRLAAVRRASFAPFTRTKVPDDLLESWVEPSLRDPAIRRDTRKLTVGMDKRHTLDAAERLRAFDRPALLVWATEDRFFKLSYAQRLAAALPDCRLVEIPNARTFVSLDQPRAVADAIASFMAKTEVVPAAAASQPVPGRDGSP